jgi:hypothetical protein
MTSITTFATSMLLSVIGMTAVGCATASGDAARDQRPLATRPTPGPVSRDDPAGLPPGRTGDALSAAEILAAPGLALTNAYDAVIRLRPWFLNPRDHRTGRLASHGHAPAVFIDGSFSGDTEALRLTPISAVAEVRYVRPSDALHQYGPRYPAGVILVRLRR